MGLRQLSRDFVLYIYNINTYKNMYVIYSIYNYILYSIYSICYIIYVLYITYIFICIIYITGILYMKNI